MGPATAAPGSQWPALALYATLNIQLALNECWILKLQFS
jgi:hypothetical protein